MPSRGQKRRLERLSAAVREHTDVLANSKTLFTRVRRRCKLSDGGDYFGQCKDGLPEGYGSCHWPDGSCYKGQWRAGKMYGYGERSSDSRCEQGNWKNNFLHGQAIVKESTPHSLSLLTANFVNGEIRGSGKLTASCNSHYYYEYSGQWKDSTWCGYGYKYMKKEQQLLEYSFGQWSTENVLETGTKSMLTDDGIWLRYKIEAGEVISKLFCQRVLTTRTKAPKNSKIIQSIFTNYAGYTFKSRLEARWAVFFDHMKLDYMYEPVCMFLPAASCNYSPDFFVPHLQLAGGRDVAVWIEIKGPSPISEELKKASELCGQTETDVYMFFGDIGTSAYTRKFSEETRVIQWHYEPQQKEVIRIESLGLAECKTCRALDIVKEASTLKVNCSCSNSQKQARTSHFFSPLFIAMKAAKTYKFS